MSIYDKASLVLIPSGTKTSKVYSQKPTNGDGDFTFSRSTAATRVNASGNIEKETQNLLLQSNQFDTTWATNNASVTSGQSGYDGSSNAWKLQSSSAGINYVYQIISSNAVQTFSIYAKAGNTDWMRINILQSGTNANNYYDISNGIKGASPSAPIIDDKIESVGNGWYRISIVVNISITQIRIQTAVADGNETSVSGDYIYIQDAQLEQGLVARDYIETTTTAIYGGITDNVPRLDCSCPALLLEPQRTNVVDYSELFTSASTWGVINIGTRTANYGISPEGVQNSTRLILSNTTDAHIFRNVGGLVDGSDYVFSCWYKGTAGETAYIRAITSGTNNTSTYKLITFTGDWQREFTTFKGGSNYNYVYPVDARAGGGDNATDFEIYGAQLEEGSYATSYIPTYGSAVTRNVGTAINNNNSNLPTGYPFSLFAEFDVVDTGSGYAITLLSASNSSNYYTIEYFSNTWHITARPNGATTRIPSSPPVTSGTHKVLGIFTDTTLKLYRNGAEIASGSHSQTFNGNIDDLLIGQLRTAGDTGTRNPVRQALVFNQALTDQEAIDLTTI
jgi:hypothetical protein